MSTTEQQNAVGTPVVAEINLNNVAALFRTAVRLKSLMWDTMGEIEKAVGHELDNLDDLIEAWAGGIDVVAQEINAEKVAKELGLRGAA